MAAASSSPARRDGLLLAVILLIAAAVRLTGLSDRGEWDDDQGTELLTLLHWVRDGQIPLVGPQASFATGHHGVAYYWILAPSAFLSDVDPAMVVTTVALIGTAGVAATWWLGRTVGGPAAGHLSALLMALSPSAIGASTFLWNANIVGPVAALAAASSWYAWRTREPGWWVLTAAATVLLVHAHLLAVLAVPPLVALFVADMLRRPRPPRRSVFGVIGATALIIAAGLTPVAVYDLRTDFSETRGIVDYLFAANLDIDQSVTERIGAAPVIGWRMLAGPVAGHVASAALSAWPAVVVTVAALITAAVATRGIARRFGGWAVITTVWAIVALALVAPSLAVSYPGLPQDQYYSWLHPIVFAAIGVAVARMWSARPVLVRCAAGAATLVCVLSSIAALPSFAPSDKGWPYAVEAAERVRAAVGEVPVAVTGVNKSGGALEFPLRRSGVQIVDPPEAQLLVMTCDPLFERSIGLACGGPAEIAEAALVGFPVNESSCFYNGPRRYVCILTRA